MSRVDRRWPWFIVVILLDAGVAVKFGLTIAVALAAASLGASLLLTCPLAGIALVILLLPIEFNLASGEGLGRITLLKLVSFLALGSILQQVLSRNKSLRWTPINLWVLLYLFLWAMALFTGSPSEGTWPLVKDIAWFISLFVIGLYGIENEEEGKRLIFLFLAEMSLISLFGYFQALAGTTWIKHFELSIFGTLLNGPFSERIKEMAESGRTYWQISYGVPRVIGTFFNPDYYCAFLGYPLCLALALALKTKGKERFWALISWILMFGNVALTYSRGGWISMALSTVAIFWVTGNGPKLLIAAAAGLPALFFFRENLQSIPAIGARFVSIGKSSHSDPRFAIWSAMLKKISDHPIFGHGQWGYVTTKRFPNGVHAHSLYLGLLYSIGIAGLTVFLILVGLTLRHTICEKNSSTFSGIYSVGFFGGLVWFLFQNGVDFQFYQSKNGGVFWLLLGLLFSTTRARELRS